MFSVRPGLVECTVEIGGVLAAVAASECSLGREPVGCFRDKNQPRKGRKAPESYAPCGADSCRGNNPRARARGYILTPLPRLKHHRFQRCTPLDLDGR